MPSLWAFAFFHSRTLRGNSKTVYRTTESAIESMADSSRCWNKLDRHACAILTSPGEGVIMVDWCHMVKRLLSLSHCNKESDGSSGWLCFVLLSTCSPVFSSYVAKKQCQDRDDKLIHKSIRVAKERKRRTIILDTSSTQSCGQTRKLQDHRFLAQCTLMVLAEAVQKTNPFLR